MLELLLAMIGLLMLCILVGLYVIVRYGYLTFGDWWLSTSRYFRAPWRPLGSLAGMLFIGSVYLWTKYLDWKEA